MPAKRPHLDEPEPLGSERDVVLGWLAFHRDALARNCADLSPAQLVEASAPPSDLTLLGLVRHLTEMEHWYFVATLSGEDPGPLYCPDDNEDGDILGLDVSMAEPSMAAWREHMARADALIAEHSLDDRTPSGRRTVRWVVLKMLEEYARHNGHADIIRERIDGTVGE
jgi:hypothetical protein